MCLGLDFRFWKMQNLTKQALLTLKLSETRSYSQRGKNKALSLSIIIIRKKTKESQQQIIISR